MSESVISGISADIAPAIDAIAIESAKRAQGRANEIARVSGGAVETTAEQLSAIQAKASDELFDELRERIRDVVRAFNLNISQG